MRQPLLLITFAAAAMAATAVQAAPSVGIFRLSQPRVAADGLSVQGTVCRVGPQRFAASPVVTIEQPGATGAVTAVLHGDVRPAGPGCFQYRAALAQPAAPARVCVSRRHAPGARLCVG